MYVVADKHVVVDKHVGADHTWLGRELMEDVSGSKKERGEREKREYAFYLVLS